MLKKFGVTSRSLAAIFVAMSLASYAAVFPDWRAGNDMKECGPAGPVDRVTKSSKSEACTKFVVADAPPDVDGRSEIVIGTSPGATTSSLAANMALPEDAIEIRDGKYIIADTHNSYLKIVQGHKISVFAGNGKPYHVDDYGLDSPDKGMSPLAIHPFGEGFFSFSSWGSGVDYHTLDGRTEFVATGYTVDGATELMSFVKFTAERNGQIVALNGTNEINRLVEVTADGLTPLATPAQLKGQSVAGFDFCGSDMIVSNVQDGGNVAFTRYRNGKATHLFTESRPYSNAIHCVGKDDFFYGARWELKRYTAGETSLVSGGFVHIASIRPTLDGAGMIVTDSDAEVITKVNYDGTQETIASTKGQLISDAIVQLKVVGNSLFAMTSDAALLRYDPVTGNAEALLSTEGPALWNHLLKGHKFSSMRAFEYDEVSGDLYIGSNHGIFRIGTRTGTFELFAGNEDEHGRVNGQRKSSRFAVVRDVLLIERRLYVADAWNDQIRFVDLDSGEVGVALGSGINETEEASSECARTSDYNLNRPFSIAAFEGSLIVANSHSHSLVAVGPFGACLFAGTAAPSIDQYGGAFLDGPIHIGKLNGPMVISQAAGGVLVADMWNNAVRFVDRNGDLKTLYHDPHLARMVSAVAVIGGSLYYASSDATVRRLRLITPSN